MDKPLTVYLQPGDFHFSDKNTRIQTLLGSCIAIVLWHPKKRIGGMCHFMLPYSKMANTTKCYDGKYADEAVQMFLQKIKHAGTEPRDYQAKIFGGGNMFVEVYGARQRISTKAPSADLVGDQNAKMAHHLVKMHGFQLASYDVGGTQHRKIIFDIDSGDVWLRKGS